MVAPAARGESGNTHVRRPRPKAILNGTLVASKQILRRGARAPDPTSGVAVSKIHVMWAKGIILDSLHG